MGTRLVTKKYVAAARPSPWPPGRRPLAIVFGGDDFSQPGASAAVMSHIAENSVNLAFLSGEFGPLATSTAAGTVDDVKLAGFNAWFATDGELHDDVITLAGDRRLDIRLRKPRSGKRRGCLHRTRPARSSLVPSRSAAAGQCPLGQHGEDHS